MYQKVSTDLNFVEREKKIEKFWKEKVLMKEVKARFTRSMTVPLRQTGHPILAMC